MMNTLWSISKHIKTRKYNKMFTATNLAKFIKNDPIPEILAQNGIKRSNGGLFTSWIASRGKEFENKLTSILTNKYSHITICSDGYESSKLPMTSKAISEGIDIIVQAPLHYKKYDIIGIADMLVRSDRFNTIFGHKYLSSKDVSKNKYVVVDIKYRTLNLASNGIDLLGGTQQKNIKFQLFIYNQALGEIIPNNTDVSFILGRKSVYTSKGVKHILNENAFRSMGQITWCNNNMITDLEAAIESSKKGKDIVVTTDNYLFHNYSSSNIYPNMKNNSYGYDSTKSNIAKRTGELTQLWNVGIKHREIALKSGVESWFNASCTAELMGFSGIKARIINQLIKINRDSSDEGFLPKNLQHPSAGTECILRGDKYYCIDFETINDLNDNLDVLPKYESNNMIYLIGLIYEEDGKVIKKQWLADELTMRGEAGIIDGLFEFIGNEVKNNEGLVHLGYWARCAEPRMLEDAICRHSEQDPRVIRKWNLSTYERLSWLDINEIFRNEPIVFSGQFGFGLKEISQLMKKFGYIKTSTGEDEVGNGMDAMVLAMMYYDNKIANDITNILKYNMDDCESVFEIIQWIKSTYGSSVNKRDYSDDKEEVVVTPKRKRLYQIDDE